MRRGARRMGQFRTRLRRSHQIVVAEQRSRDDPARRTQRSDHHIARHNRKNATLRDRNRSRRGRIRNRSNPRRTGGHCFDAEQTCSLNVEESPARLDHSDRLYRACVLTPPGLQGSCSQKPLPQLGWLQSSRQ